MLCQKPGPELSASLSESYQDSGYDERFVCQRLWDINIQTGGVHGQGVVRVPDPDLKGKTTQEDVMSYSWVIDFFFFTAVVGYPACMLHKYLCENINTVGLFYGQRSQGCFSVHILQYLYKHDF